MHWLSTSSWILKRGISSYGRVLNTNVIYKRPEILFSTSIVSKLIKNQKFSTIARNSFPPGTRVNSNGNRFARNLGKLVIGIYGTLAIIPIGFSTMAMYHYVKGDPWQNSRAYMFFAWTGYLSLPFSVVLLASVPFVFLMDPHERKFLDQIQKQWARTTCRPFFVPKLEGLENLHGLENQPVVIVSNHQSWADIYSLFWLPVPIRFVAKQEIFLIPVAGWSMGLIGHVGVTRHKTNGPQSSVVEICIEKVRSGVSICFFPEGTRSKTGEIGPFRNGAFVVAYETKVPIVPISITGAGAMMPPGETWMDTDIADVHVHVHEPIDPNNFATMEDLRNYTRNVIINGTQ